MPAKGGEKDEKIYHSRDAVVFLLMAGYYAYYHEGLYLRLGESGEVTSFMSTDADTIYMTRDGERAPLRSAASISA